MEIEYRRELEKSYMVIHREKKDWEDFEIQMLLSNKIEGMVPFFLLIEDGKNGFVYDITGKQSLDIYIRRKGLKQEVYEKLFCSLKRVHRSIEDYLLDENALLLTEEMIFVDNSGQEFSYCYLPGHTYPVNQAMQSLLESFLGKAAPNDSTLLEKLHQAHQDILTGNFSLRRNGINGLRVERKDAEAELVWEAEEKKENYEEEKAETESSSSRIKEKFSQSFKKLSKATEKTEDKKEHKIKKFWDNEKENGQIGIWENGQKDGKENKEHKLKSWFRDRQEENAVYGDYQMNYHPDTGIVEEEYIHPTVYIGGDRLALSGRFESKNTSLNTDFEILSEEVLVGKQPEEADICLNGDTVSRVHAVIRKEEDNYFIEDLNSTNGTFVNQVQIPYRESVMLHYGDEVMFGAVKFIFY